MDVTFVFILGLIITLIGVIPPGLLNISAAKISLKDGFSRGIMFSIGVCIIVCIQTLVAAIFAKYLSKHPSVIAILKRVALVIFVLITVYYLFLVQQQPKPKKEWHVKSKKSRFFQGMLLSILNVFPIPYQAYMVITIATFGWLQFNTTHISSYVAGAACGTFIMLYIYIFFFKRIKSKSFVTQRNMNYSIGIVTGLISLITLIDLIREL